MHPINRYIALTSVFGFLLPDSVAHGEEEQADTPENHRYGVTWNPLASVLIQSSLNDLKEEEALIELGVSDFNLRFQHRLNRKIGFTVQAEYTRLSTFIQTTYVGIRGGPRFFFHPTKLNGWSSTPFVTLGRSIITAGSYSLSSWVVCGAGGELNYTHLWGPILIELGLGGYFTQNLGYSIHADSLQGTAAPAPMSEWKPLLTMGIGYAF